MIRFFAFTGVVVLLALTGSAEAHSHINGQALVQGRPNGKHAIHATGKHTAHAHVQGGKVAQVSVTHKTKGNVGVTKYKSKRRLHASLGSDVQHHYVSLDDTQETGFVATVYVGFGFIDDFGQLVIYWFPITLVLGGDSGATSMDPA